MKKKHKRCSTPGCMNIVPRDSKKKSAKCGTCSPRVVARDEKGLAPGVLPLPSAGLRVAGASLQEKMERLRELSKGFM